MQRSQNSKIAIANAFKDLLDKKKFSDITVCLICEQANISRKIFYKHFKDKFDLVYFIFKEDFKRDYYPEEKNFSKLFSCVIQYFYDNKKLYKKLFSVTAQNSFSETFHSLLYQGLYNDKYLLCFEDEADRDFAVCFFTDALTISIRGWITNDNPEPAEEYLLKVKRLFMPVVNSNIIDQKISK